MAAKDRRPKETVVSENEFVVPENERALLTWLVNKKELGRRGLPELMFKLNLAFMLGHQWVVWDQNQRALRRPTVRTDDPNAPVRITANKIGGISERFIARLLKAAQEPETRPVSDDEADVMAAKAGTRILISELRRMRWESWLMSHYFWPVAHGWAYAQVTWDPMAGTRLGEATPTNASAPVAVYEGDITIETVPAFELAVDPNATSMRDAKWAIRTRMMTREAIWEKYGKVPADAEHERTVADEVYSLADGSVERTRGVDTSNQVAIHQFWMVPCRAAPKGLVVTWSGSTILEAPKPFPYGHGRLPFLQSDLLPGMGTREGRTWLTDLIPLQTDYNDARSREAAIRRTLTPKLIYPTGSIVPGMMTSRVEGIPYNPVGEAPKLMIPDSGWLAQYETSMNRADMEMGDRAGQSDVSSGKPASASMPAAAILALQEADDTKLAISAKLLASFVEEIGWHVLMLVKQFWSEDRLVRTWSEEGHLEVKRFSGADVQRQLDVNVSTESAVARSKSAMVQLALDLFNAGIITDPRHVLRLIQMPGSDFLTDALNVDARQAQRENERLMLGEMVEIHAYDNHMVHIAEHDNYRKGEEYEKLARAAAEGDLVATQIKAAIDGHAQAHYEQVLPQLGVPTPGGTDVLESEFTGPRVAAYDTEDYIDPLTGLPPNPTQVAAGQSPSALENSQFGESSIRERAGIGGPGQPGQVQGVDADTQASRMGA